MKPNHHYNKKQTYKAPGFKSKKIKVFFKSRFFKFDFEPSLLAADSKEDPL